MWYYGIKKVTIGRKNAYFLVKFSYSQSKVAGTMILPVNLNTGKIGDPVKFYDDDTDGVIVDIGYENGYIYYEVAEIAETDSDSEWDYSYTRIKVS